MDHNLDEIVGKSFQRSQYDQYNQKDSIHDVIVVYRNGNPIACGAFKLYDEEHAELKRLYTDPSNRNIGLGTKLYQIMDSMPICLTQFVWNEKYKHIGKAECQWILIFQLKKR